MKKNLVYSLIVAALSLAGASTACADDQQLHARIAAQRDQTPTASRQSHTVAVFIRNHGVRNTAGPDVQRSELQSVPNGHGATHNLYRSE